MIKLYDNGVYLVNGTDIVEDNGEAAAALTAKCGQAPSKQEAAKGTMAYSILEAHNTSGNMEQLQIKFDKLTSHDLLELFRPLVHPGWRSSLSLTF